MNFCCTGWIFQNMNMDCLVDPRLLCTLWGYLVERSGSESRQTENNALYQITMSLLLCFVEFCDRESIGTETKSEIGLDSIR